MRQFGFPIYVGTLLAGIGGVLGAARWATRPPALPAPASVSVPLDFRDGRLVVTAHHAGEPLRLILDTGAERSAISRHALRRIEAPLLGRTRLLGAGGERDVPVAVLGPLDFGDLRIGRLPALVLDGALLGGYDGILGLDLLQRLPLRIDAPADRLDLGAPAAIAGLPLRDVGSGIVAFEVTVNGAPATAILDTGLPRTLLNPAAARVAGLGGRKALPVRGVDGNAIRTAADTVTRIAAGEVTLLANAEVRIADAPLFAAAGLADRPALLLGADAFRDCAFVIVWDTLRLVPCAD